MSAIEGVTAFLEARAAAEGPWDSDYVAGYTYHPLLASDLRELVELAGGTQLGEPALPAAAAAVLADVMSELHEAVAQGQVDTAEGYAADVAARLQRGYGVTAPTETPEPIYCPDCGAYADDPHRDGCPRED